MNAGDVMTTGAAMVRPDESLAEAGRILVNAELAAFLLRISRLAQPSLPSRSNDVFREGD
jgi:hypothetical protein